MKLYSKIAAILVASVLAFSFFGCEEPRSDDGDSKLKLGSPTNLVINSIKDASMTEPTAEVNISFDYDKKKVDVSHHGASYGPNRGILGYSTTNDSSKAIYDSYNSTVTVQDGSNTRTAEVLGLKLVKGKTYYFWLKFTSNAYDVHDSDWSNVATFTYEGN